MDVVVVVVGLTAAGYAEDFVVEGQPNSDVTVTAVTPWLSPYKESSISATMVGVTNGRL